MGDPRDVPDEEAKDESSYLLIGKGLSIEQMVDAVMIHAHGTKNPFNE